MTVKELIQALQQHPGHLRVVQYDNDAYTGDDILVVKKMLVAGKDGMLWEADSDETPIEPVAPDPVILVSSF